MKQLLKYNTKRNKSDTKLIKIPVKDPVCSEDSFKELIKEHSEAIKDYTANKLISVVPNQLEKV